MPCSLQDLSVVLVCSSSKRSVIAKDLTRFHPSLASLSPALSLLLSLVCVYHCSLVARLLIYESMLKVTDSRIYGSQKPSVHNLPNPAENNCSWLVINIGYGITCLIYAGPCHPKNSVLRPLRFPSIREYFELLTASHLSNRMSTKTHGSKDYLQDEIRYPCAEASMIVHAVYEI